jgi:hypothetical protein
MTYQVSTSKVVSIRPGDPNFQLVDGFTLTPRAMLHILPECPKNIRDYINWAVSEGYVKCVANVYDYEQTFDLLKHQWMNTYVTQTQY